MKIVILPLIYFFMHSTFADECIMPHSLSEVEKLSLLAQGSECDPLNKSTWDPSWKSPCECINRKDPYTRLKSANNKIEQKQVLEKIAAESEVRVAEAIRSQIQYQIEQSLRLDVYLKKAIISTTNNLNNSKIDSNLRVSIPSSCYLNKIGEMLKTTEGNSICNSETKEKRLNLLFGQKGFEGWKSNQLKILEKVTQNQLDERDMQKGLCIPYKSYLSLSNSNPLRSTYLKIASVFKKDFSGFQRWAQDRSRPDDAAKIIHEASLKAEKITSKDLSLRSLATTRNLGIGRMMTEIISEDEKRNLSNGIEEISKDDITNLIKTDPIFERMMRDEEFYNQIVSQQNPESINENDPRIIKLISESQNRSCEALYGVSEAPEIESVPSDNVQPGKGRGRGKLAASDSSKQFKNSLLFDFLCNEESPKQFINEKYIKTMLSPEINRQLRLKSKADSEMLITDYLYCSGEKPAAFIADEAWRVEFNTSTSKVFASPNPLHNLLDSTLNPESDIRGVNASTARSHYHKFNAQVCKRLPIECKDLKNANPQKCEISVFSKEVAENLISSKLSSPESTEMRTELLNSLHDLTVSDKALRSLLSSSSNFDSDEINTILVLRQQMPSFIKANAEEELRAILGIDKSIKIDDTFYQSRGGIDKLFSGNPSLTIDLKQRLTDISQKQNKSLIAAEDVEDEQSSYFSNYFALGDSKDENVAKKGKISSLRGSNDNTFIGVGRAPATQTSHTTDTEQEHYVRKAFRPKPKSEVEPPVVKIVEKPEDKKETPKQEKDEAVSEGDEGGQGRSRSRTVVKTLETEVPLLTVVSDTSSSTSKANKSKNQTTKSSKQDDVSEEQLDDIQGRIDDLSSMAEMIKKIKAERASNSSTGSTRISESGDDKAFRDEIKRLQDEESRLGDKERRIADKERQIRNKGFFGNGLSGGNQTSGGGYVDPYDPLERNSTGKRALSDDKNSEEENDYGAAGAGKEAKTGKNKGNLSASLNDAEAVGSAPSEKRRLRFPASENGESDPDDLCGYEQELSCYFEYASIDVLSPSVSRFVEYLELQGRSFKAVEVFKYKNNVKPTRYFIHYYEPLENMTEEDKIALYKRSKELLKDYKKNKKELKTIASQVVEVKKVEVTKDEVKELSKSILRVPDLNKLSERRARNQ